METTRPGYHGLPYLKALLLAAQGKRNEALTLHRNSEIYALLGMNDEAIDGLRSEIRGSATFPYCYYFNLLNDPFYRKLHGDPRFDEILRVEHRLYDNLMDRYDRLRPSPE
jgi:hypothetical protein